MVKNFEWSINISLRDSGTLKHIYVTTFATQDDMKACKKTSVYAKLFPVSLAVSDDVAVVDY